MTSEIVPLFSTPVVISDLPEAASINGELAKVIAERHKSHPGTQHSNLGGWQSTWDMDRWGGASAIKLLAIGRNLANRYTTDREGKPASVTWRAKMWANVNKAGHGNFICHASPLSGRHRVHGFGGETRCKQTSEMARRRAPASRSEFLQPRPVDPHAGAVLPGRTLALWR